MYSEEELHDHVIFGLSFKATDEEQRQLWLKLSTSPQSREWGIARNMIALTEAPVPQPCHEALALLMEEADTAMTRLSFKLIGEMLASRERGNE